MTAWLLAKTTVALITESDGIKHGTVRGRDPRSRTGITFPSNVDDRRIASQIPLAKGAAPFAPARFGATEGCRYREDQGGPLWPNHS